MKRGVMSRLNTGLIAVALVLTQVLVPVSSAFAAGKDNEPKDDQLKKVYVCKYVGTPGVDERIQTGQNPIEVSVNALGKDWNGTVPGYFNDAQERSYVLGYVTDAAAPSVLDCPNVANPNISVEQTVVCGPNNDTITATANTGVAFSYSEWVNNSLTVTAALQAGYSWSDGTTVAKQIVKTDAATLCPTEDEEVNVPTPDSVDPCGPMNASWAEQATADEYDWSINEQSELIVTAKTGFYFMVEGEKQTVINFGLAEDSNEVCPPTVTVCPATLPTIRSTDKDANGWTVPADAEYLAADGGIKLTVSGNWDSSYISRAMVGPLADIGSVVNFEATPEQYVGIHIETDDGRFLTYEKEASYGGKWWSTSDFNVDSGMGYATFDTLENIVAANPDVMTSTLYVLYTHPSQNSSIIKSVTVGCTEYVFSKTGGSGGNPTVPPVTVVPTVPVVTTPVVPAAGQGVQLPGELPMTGQNGSVLFTWIALLAAILTYGSVYYLQPKKRFEQ